MGWFYSTTQQLKLVNPEHDQNLLPVPRRNTGRFDGRFETARKAARTSLQVVSEFRAKMRIAEELIAKLAFSLREIQGTRRRSQAGLTGNVNTPPAKPAQVIQVDADRFSAKA